MKCPACQHENPPEALFCMKCGTKLERRCPRCNAEYPEEAHFCMKCGEKLEEDTAPLEESEEDADPEAERRQLQGELLIQKAVPDEQQAETCFLQAIEVARRLQSKSWELRAVLSLSRLWQRQGKKEEAYQALQEIYDWFTEGFETVDLKEAKELLDELS